jgi:hypothetical protein
MEIGAPQAQAGMAIMAKSLQEATVGADVINKTLNTVNQLGSGSNNTNSDYDFQTKVLMAGALGKGENLSTAV